MGLPGSGKTTLAGELQKWLQAHWNPSFMPVEQLAVAAEVGGVEETCRISWFNADQVRKRFNDWDFSTEGRIRQSLRMLDFALSSNAHYVICDFVAPLPEMRTNFKADWTIWMDTIDAGRFEDTNQMFVPPQHYDFRITEKHAQHWAAYIGHHILNNQRRPQFDWRQPTVQMLGRWQPWHAGHRALFERLLERTGQVIIQIRDVQGWQGSNPFELQEVERRIRRDLDPLYQGQYDIQVVPNIVHIGWGRGVGYSAGEETFDVSITDISATKIRQEMGLK